MLSWYHRLWRLVARAVGAPQPPPGSRRNRVRPRVEALEDRWVPSHVFAVPAGTQIATVPDGGGPFGVTVSGVVPVQGTLHSNDLTGSQRERGVPVNLVPLAGGGVGVVLLRTADFDKSGFLPGTLTLPGHDRHGPFPPLNLSQLGGFFVPPSDLVIHPPKPHKGRHHKPPPRPHPHPPKPKPPPQNIGSFGGFGGIGGFGGGIGGFGGGGFGGGFGG
jgi:hypothetical protein